MYPLDGGVNFSARFAMPVWYHVHVVSESGGNMRPTMQSLGIDQMSRDERIALIQEIWNTIADEPPLCLLTEAQQAELDRRIADDDANPDDVVPWEQVEAQALARLEK